MSSFDSGGPGLRKVLFLRPWRMVKPTNAFLCSLNRCTIRSMHDGREFVTGWFFLKCAMYLFFVLSTNNDTKKSVVL